MLKSSPNPWWKVLGLHIAGLLLLPALWVVVKYGFGISDRYLPGPLDVIRSVYRIDPNLAYHFLMSFLRLTFGFCIGVVGAVVLGVFVFRYRTLELVISPSLQGIRSVPPAATIPFFILWFGFSEYGKIVLIAIGIAANLAISVWQVLCNMPEKYAIALHGFRVQRAKIEVSILVPLALEKLLPTLRFSLAVAIGLVVMAEYMGAQSGLGYVIQSARTTFSFDVVTLCAIFFGLMMWISDLALCYLWRWLIPWNREMR